MGQSSILWKTSSSVQSGSNSSVFWSSESLITRCRRHVSRFGFHTFSHHILYFTTTRKVQIRLVFLLFCPFPVDRLHISVCRCISYPVSLRNSSSFVLLIFSFTDLVFLHLRSPTRGLVLPTYLNYHNIVVVGEIFG